MEQWGPLLVALEMTGPWLEGGLLQGSAELMLSSWQKSERKQTDGIYMIMMRWRCVCVCVFMIIQYVMYV